MSAIYTAPSQKVFFFLFHILFGAIPNGCCQSHVPDSNAVGSAVLTCLLMVESAEWATWAFSESLASAWEWRCLFEGWMPVGHLLTVAVGPAHAHATNEYWSVP